MRRSLVHSGGTPSGGNARGRWEVFVSRIRLNASDRWVGWPLWGAASLLKRFVFIGSAKVGLRCYLGAGRLCSIISYAEQRDNSHHEHSCHWRCARVAPLPLAISSRAKPRAAFRLNPIGPVTYRQSCAVHVSSKQCDRLTSSPHPGPRNPRSSFV